MAKYKLTTPQNMAFGGKRHGIKFYRGEAIAEDIPQAVLTELESWGIVVEEIDKPAKKAPAKKK